MTAYPDIDTYIASFPAEIQAILHKLRAVIHNAAPGAEEAMAYQIPTFRLHGANLVHFAAFKNHVGFYPAPSGIEAFKGELSPYAMSKGAVQFPLDRAIPYDLVARIVLFRAQENLARAETKAKKKK